MNQPWVIRTALPAEIGEVIAIDDDACGLYDEAGLHLDMGPDHPFARAEWGRWAQSARRGDAFLAGLPAGPAVGMLVMGRVDGAPHVDQLSVRRSAMRRGLGRFLLMHAIEWAAGDDLWLTTYGHVPWNRPFYQRHGFSVVPEARCPPEIVAILEDQRRWLPAPEQRIAMRRPAQTPRFSTVPRH
jgi:GNAT superfamily N-acetyltransferase